MLDFLKELDIKLFLFLNGIHGPSGDFIMYWLSHKYIWIPLYALLLYLLVRIHGKKAFLLIFMVALLITVSDQVSVHLFKNVFQRLRPCHEPGLEGMVYTLGRCGGKYGFISSHASNSFAIAAFVGLLLWNKIRWLSLFMLSWAAMVSYSRVYLGVHYPADIVVGGIVGTVEALLVSRLWFWIKSKIWKNEQDY